MHLISVDPEISKESGKLYYLPENRVYETYQEMFEKEAKLPEGERMDFVSIVTPNFVHFDPAMLALDNGFHVVLDKPITFTLDEALKLKEKINETGLTFALTHTYSGYPAVKHAKQITKIKEQIKDEGRTIPEIAKAISVPASQVLVFVSTLKKYGQVVEGAKDGDYLKYQVVN